MYSLFDHFDIVHIFYCSYATTENERRGKNTDRDVNIKSLSLTEINSQK